MIKIALVVLFLVLLPGVSIADEIWWWIDARGGLQASNCPTRFTNKCGLPQLENIGGSRQDLCDGQTYAAEFDFEKLKAWRAGLLSMALEDGRVVTKLNRGQGF